MRQTKKEGGQKQVGTEKGCREKGTTFMISAFQRIFKSISFFPTLRNASMGLKCQSCRKAKGLSCLLL
jgi:hypothetical protein